MILTTATASAAVNAPAILVNLIGWLSQQPLVWAVALPALVGAAKKLPAIGEGTRPIIRATAGVLSLVAALLMAWAGGNLAGFDFQTALTTIGEAGLVYLGAAGLYHHAKDAKATGGATPPPAGQPVPPPIL